MKVRDALLALLARGPAHGYQLKLDYERLTGNPRLNVGQIYQTLDRLQRDGLVERAPGGGDERRITYQVTEDGRAEAEALLLEPGDRSDAAIPGSALRVLLAVETPGIDPFAIVDAHRATLMRTVRDVRRAQRGTEAGMVERLGTEAHLAATEAELRWLDLCEEELQRGR